MWETSPDNWRISNNQSINSHTFHTLSNNQRIESYTFHSLSTWRKYIWLLHTPCFRREIYRQSPIRPSDVANLRLMSSWFNAVGNICFLRFSQLLFLHHLFLAYLEVCAHLMQVALLLYVIALYNWNLRSFAISSYIITCNHQFHFHLSYHTFGVSAAN